MNQINISEIFGFLKCSFSSLEFIFTNGNTAILLMDGINEISGEN